MPRHVQIMQSRVGIVEKSRNSGPQIDQWLSSVGLRPGNPYCAACISHALKQAGVTSPKIMSGLAMSFRTKGSFKATDVINGTKTVLPGDLPIWQKGNSIFGHIGVAERRIDRRTIVTIEANTSSGLRGSQRDGNGVYRRTRKIEPFNHFGIRYFTRPTYA